MKFKPFFALLVACLTFSAACKKEPGPGGQASITGKLKVQAYNGTCTVLQSEYYGIDEDVFIIYGDTPGQGERVRTGPNGTYYFPYLQKGKYTIYALSENCAAPGELEAIKAEVPITERKQATTLEDIVVIR